jgi:polyisoprenyl-phosphate glycosyltransferase
MKISIVCPVYRCDKCLVELHERLTEVLRCICGDSYEIIFIEDCGEDDSWHVIESLASSDTHVRGIQLSRNFGQHHSITAGLDICDGEWAVILDCDLQDDPGDIAKLWGKAQDGFDVVNARRANRRDAGWKQLSSRLFHIIFRRLSGVIYDPQVANFRIISRRAIDAYNQMRETSRSLGAQLQWLGFPTGYIDVPHQSRFDGTSSYDLASLTRLALTTIMSYSNMPLRMSIAIGLLIASGAAAASVWVMIRTVIWKVPVEGWASLMVSIWFLGGAIIANIGIVGLYIGKIYDETKRRPLYAVAKAVNCDLATNGTALN